MNTIQIKSALVIFTMVVLTSFTTYAQEGNREDRKTPPTFEKLIKEMDANEDGMLSRAELKGPLKEHFETVDSDEDGFITKEEFDKAPRPKRRERRQ